MLLKNIKIFVKKDFSKNILTLMTGSAGAQLISLLIIPVLSRLFSPEEFGIYAVFFGLSSILISISGGRYELAIMLPKNDNNAYQIMLISFFFVFLITLLSLIVILAFNSAIADFFKIPKDKNSLFYIPISVFFSGSFLVLSNWFSRFKKFKHLAVSKIAQSSGSAATKTGFGFLNFPASGLIIGDIVGQFFALSYLMIKNKKHIALDKYHKDIAVLKKEWAQNRNFPLFSMPMAFLNSISIHILIYVITLLFSSAIVGFYLQANKVISYPLNFITTSFTSVFYQKLTDTKNKLKLYFYSYMASFAIASFVCFPFLFWGEEIFEFVLGKEWAFSGKIAQILIPVTIAGFATRNVSSVFSLLKNQQISLIWQALYLGIAILIFFRFSGATLEKILLYYSVFGACMYILLGIIGFLLLKKNMFKFTESRL